MEYLGGFSPTNNVQEKEIKGYTSDSHGEVGTSYWSSDDLYRMANHLKYVANWLEQRVKD